MTRNVGSVGIAGIGLCVIALASAAPAGAPTGDDAAATAEEGVSDSTATSAEAFGGRHVVVKAGPEEGELTAFVLTPDWADGEIVKTFSKTYDVKVNPAEPDGASQDELKAANRPKGTNRAPEVSDLGRSVALPNVALASKDMSAPYQMDVDEVSEALLPEESGEETSYSIPDSLKEPNGLGASDHGGSTSVGYDPSGIPDVEGLENLLSRKVEGRVILEVDPAQAGAATSGLHAGGGANGDSADHAARGVENLAKLENDRHPLPVDPSPPDLQPDQTAPSSSDGTTSTPSTPP